MARTTLQRIVIFGSSGRTGRLLTHAFSARGHDVIGVGRREAVLADLPCTPVVFDLEEGHRPQSITRPGDVVVNAAHARFTRAIASLCAPDIARLVVIGSMRYKTRFPDSKARQVQDAAAVLEEGNLPWVMLHPTMIYGAEGENNVQRMAALIRRFHVIPLPLGGRSLIQPVHVNDVVDAVVAAALKPDFARKTVNLGGPQAVSYRAFLEEIAQASGTWVRVLPLPLSILQIIAAVTRLLPGVPSITGAEVRRLMEDKAVDVSEMETLLGVTPRSLAQGLEETFRA